MATTTTIRGITYNAGNTFTTRSGYWYGSADGGQGSGSITSGKTVTFYEDRTGWADWYYHPILCKGGVFNGGDYFWTDKSVFPYASVTVTFNANGGAAVSNRTYTWTDASNGIAGNFPSTTRTGYKHTGWTISGTTYSATSNVINSWISARNGQTVTATAVWEAQASPISSVGAITYGTGTSTTGSVTWTPYNSTYRYAIKAELGSKSLVLPASGYITPNSTNPYTYNFSFDSSWINQVPNSKQGTVTYTLYTYTSTGTSNIGYATKPATITVPTNIKPSVSIGSITAANTPTFTGKIVTGVDKFSIPWTYDNSSDYSSPLASLTCVANGETLTVTSGTSGNIQTNNYIQAYGPQTITVDCKDARGNSATQASATVNVYWYFAPQITAKYEHNANGYFVNVTGKIAYVNGSNAKSLTLNIKDKNGTITGTHDLTSLIGAHISDSGQNNYIYDHIYPIGISYQITDVNNEIPNIMTETYSFEVVATDTVYTGSNSIKSTSVSGIPVMTFGAGGADITAHKPLIVEDWTQLEKPLYLRNDSADGGGIARFIPQNDDGSNTMYIDTYQQNLRIGSSALGGYVAQAKPNGYFNVRNGYQIGNTQVYPPKITKDANTSTWDGQSVTTNYVIKEYSSGYKEIYAAAIFKLPLNITYGSLYYNDPNLNIPTSFFSGGTGDLYFMSSARASQGIFSTNVHTWSTSTGNVAVFVGSPVKPSSGTWNVEVYVYGAKF